MTPTRYPTWRSRAFWIAILMFLGLAVKIGRIRPLPLYPGQLPTALRASVFAQLVVFAGALRSRPALGFFMFGAGFLVDVVRFAVLLSWERPLAIPVAVLLVPGIGFTWLRAKEQQGRP